MGRVLFCVKVSENRMYKILIVEDDANIAALIKEQLESWDFEVLCASDFKDVLTLFLSEKPQLVLLDISLPFFSGYYWCEQIRKLSKVPIIFISSASDNMNIVMAISLGADDFVAKPFDTEVLTAKIKALLRRTYDFTDEKKVLQHKNVVLNTSDGSLHYGEHRLELTKNEHKLLLFLFQNKQKVVSREKLMEILWQTDSFVDDNTLTVNINRLRKKLDAIGLPGFITTKFGEGYLLQ